MDKPKIEFKDTSSPWWHWVGLVLMVIVTLIVMWAYVP